MVFQQFNRFPHRTVLENVTEAPLLVRKEKKAVVMKGLTHSGMMMVVVTHDIGFACEVADQIIFMDQGNVVETGTAQQGLDVPQHQRTRDFLATVL